MGCLKGIWCDPSGKEYGPDEARRSKPIEIKLVLRKTSLSLNIAQVVLYKTTST